MKNKIGIFSLGLVVGIALTAGTTIGAANILKATPKTVKIIVDSNQKTVEAMNVQNKLYVPVRDAGASFGYGVSGVTSNTVTFVESKSIATKEDNGSTDTINGSTSPGNKGTETKGSGGQYVQGLHEKYSTDGKLDANKIKTGIAAGEITVNAQDKETGSSLLQMVIKENNFAVYSIIKVNALNVNLQDNDGNTALHTATLEKNNFYFGELTTQLKADATLKNKDGKQAIDLTEKGDSYYIELRAYMM